MPSFYIRLPDTSRLRTAGEFAFSTQGADGIATELQDALRRDGLFARWRAAQEDPDAVDPALGATDPDAKVTGQPDDLHLDLIVHTQLPGPVLKHRLRLLAGSAWELRDVSA